ncbi:MAG: diguanylate cyclase [Gammaproteobacteria bacterium]|nr:diguanylate cyclase [Gammaproteobacteria bacterium]
MLSSVILISAIIFQTAAAIFALLLIPVTGKRFAWIMISAALILMDVRRIMAFLILKIKIPTLITALVYSNDAIGLLLSIFMLIGVSGILTIFSDIKKSGENKIRTVFDQTFEFIGLMTTDGILVDANKAALKSAGVEESAVIGKPFWETPWWTHSKILQDKLKAAIKDAARGKFIRFEATHPTKDGGLITVDFSLKPVFDSFGKVVLLVPEGRDITDRKTLSMELQQQKLLNESIINTMINGVIAVENSGKVILLNKRFNEMWQIPVEILNTNDVNKYITYALKNLKHPGKFLDGIRELYLNKEKKNRDEVEFKDGKIFERYSTPLKDIDGLCYGRVWFFRDITEQRKMEAEIQHRLLFEETIGQIAKQLSAIDFFEIDHWVQDSLNVIGEFLGADLAYIYLFSDDGTIMRCNYKWLANSSCAKPPQEFPKNSFSLLNVILKNNGSVQIHDVSELNETWEKEKQIWENENIKSIICVSLTIQHKQIGFACFGSSCKKIAWSGAEVSLLKTIGEIIVAALIRKKAGEELDHLAKFDALTNLPNKHTFEMMLDKTLAFSYRHNLQFALLSFDLDNFKDINDTHGHDVGDELLTEVGNRLSASVRAEDFVARVGGDEFLLILAGISSAQNASDIANKILDSFKQEFQLKKQSLAISASIGIACFPDHGKNKEELTKNADVALYKAKNAGRNCYRVFAE